MVGVQCDLGSHIVRGVSVRRHRAKSVMIDVGQVKRMNEVKVEVLVATYVLRRSIMSVFPSNPNSDWRACRGGPHIDSCANTGPSRREYVQKYVP